MLAANGAAPVDWRPLLLEAYCNPFTTGFVVTGMLMTTLLPTILHFGHSLAAIVYAAWPRSEVALGYLACLESEKISEGEKDHAARRLVHYLMGRKVAWHVFSGLAFVMIGGLVWLLNFTLTQQLSGGLVGLAIWSVSWLLDGQVGLMEIFDNRQALVGLCTV